MRKRTDMGDKNLLERGFTLVELLIVVTILGILAGVVVFAVGNFTTQAKSSACGTEKTTLETAVEAYRSMPNHAPTDNPTVSDLKADKLIKTDPVSYTVTGGNVVALSPNPNGCS
jgi:general secretion pathway protein G